MRFSPAPMSSVAAVAKSDRIGIGQTRLLHAQDDDIADMRGRDVHSVPPRGPGRSAGPSRLKTTKLTGEFKAAAVDARLHGALRQMQAIGDLLIRELLQVAQHDGLLERRRQLGERLADQMAQVELLELAVRPALARHRHQIRRVHVARHRLAFLADAAIVVDAEIPADADEPGLEIGAPIERVQRLEDLQEDVLRQVLGLVVPADELVGQVEHLAPVLPDDLLPTRPDRPRDSAR